MADVIQLFAVLAAVTASIVALIVSAIDRRNAREIAAEDRAAAVRLAAQDRDAAVALAAQDREASAQLAAEDRAAAARVADEQARPFVVVDVRFLGALYACIDVLNAGQTAARNIRFVWSERPVAIDEHSQAALDRSMVDGSIPFLAPGRKISFMLNRYDDAQDSTELTRRFEVKAVYEGPTGDTWDSESVLDVDQWAATLVQGDAYADVTSELKKLVAAAQNQKQADEALTRAADSLNVHLEAGFRVQMARQRIQEEREARWKLMEEREARLFGRSTQSEPGHSEVPSASDLDD